MSVIGSSSFILQPTINVKGTVHTYHTVPKNLKIITFSCRDDIQSRLLFI
jgi:hypothetical protein